MKVVIQTQPIAVVSVREPRPMRVEIKALSPSQGQPGEGVPVGGTTNQVLIKSSDADYDTEWKGLISLYTRAERPVVGDYIGQEIYQTDELFGFYKWDGNKWSFIQDGDTATFWRVGAFTYGFSTTTANGGSASFSTGENYGGLLLQAGTAANGRAGLNANTWRAVAGVSLCISISVYIPGSLVSTNDSKFNTYIGSSFAGAEPNNGAFFKYDHTQNNGNWQCRSTRDGGATYGTVNTNVPYGSPVNHTQQFVILQEGTTSVKFYIDGVLVGHIEDGTVENSSNLLGGMMVVKESGAANPTIYMRQYVSKFKTALF